MASQPWRDQQLWCKQLPKRRHCQKWGLAKWHMWITGWLVWACLSMTSLSRIWETLYDLARYTHKLSVQILHWPQRKIPKVPVANNIYVYIYIYLYIFLISYLRKYSISFQCQSAWWFPNRLRVDGPDGPSPRTHSSVCVSVLGAASDEPQKRGKEMYSNP